MLIAVQPSSVQVFDRLPKEQRDRGNSQPYSSRIQFIAVEASMCLIFLFRFFFITILCVCWEGSCRSCKAKLRFHVLAHNYVRWMCLTGILSNKEVEGMTEGDQSSHRLRDAGTVPMCICLHLYPNYCQAAHTDQEARS